MRKPLNWEKFRAGFGVSSLVSEKSVIYYHVIFNAHLLGTVSDLLSIHLKKEGLDEFRLRALLVFLILPAYQDALIRNQNRSLFRWSIQENLEFPLLFECAVDSAYFVFVVSFSYGSKTPFQLTGIIERLRSRKPQNIWEQVLIDLERFSEKVILKCAPELSKVELTILLKREGRLAKRASVPTEKASEFELIILPGKNIHSGPAPKTYISLGDLDDLNLMKPQEPPARITQDHQVISSRTVRGSSEADPSVTRVKNFSESDDTRIRVQGAESSGKLEESKTQVKGIQSEAEAEAETRIHNTTDRIQTWISKKFANRLWGAVEKQTPSSSSESVELKVKSEQKSDKPESKRLESKNSEIKGPEPEKPKSEKPESKTKHAEAVKESKSQSQPVSDAEPITVPEPESVPALVSVSESVRPAKEATSKSENEENFPQKEIRYKSEIATLRMELKKKEVEVSQKIEQVRFVTQQIKNIKEEFHALKQQSMDSESVKLRGRNQQLEEMVIRLKDENGQLTKSVSNLKDELKNSKAVLAKLMKKEMTPQLTGAEAGKNEMTSDEPDSKSYRELQAKFNAVSRENELQSKRLEELKKANQNLMSHLNEPKQDTSAISAGETEKMRERLKVSMQMLADTRKETLSLKEQVVSLLEENEKAKARTAELESQIKSTPTPDQVTGQAADR